MIAIDKLKNVKRLITHSNCPDGIASALIVKDALPDVEVTFMSHGTEEHRMLEPQPGVLFCDFTPLLTHEQLTYKWIEAGAIVLDHHPTQREATMRFVNKGLGVYGENDKNECGAWLAYEHVWLRLQKDVGFWSPGEYEKVRDFAKLASVRDTWKKDDPRWQAACEQAEALMFWGFDKMVELWGRAAIDAVTESSRILGRHLFEKKLEHARKAIGESHYFETTRGTNVLVFQGVTPTSDAAEILEKEEGGDRSFPKDRVHLVAGFHYRVDAGKLKLQFSTRSHTGYDVGAFCKSKGGGGHRAAAGFTAEQSAEVGANPYAVFKLLLEEWEQGQ